MDEDVKLQLTQAHEKWVSHHRVRRGDEVARLLGGHVGHGGVQVSRPVPELQGRARRSDAPDEVESSRGAGDGDRCPRDETEEEEACGAVGDTLRLNRAACAPTGTG